MLDSLNRAQDRLLSHVLKRWGASGVSDCKLVGFAIG